jgi:hypothetical protein
MSGDMNTGLGNTLLMSTLLHAFCAAVGLDASLANNGDDAVLFLDEEDLDKISGMSSWFYDRGFTLKIETPVYRFESIEFCQCHPVETSTGWRMVRSLSAFSKDIVCLGCTTERQALKWLYAVGECGMSLYSDIPIFGQFYRNFLRFGTKGKVNTALLEGVGMYRNSRFGCEIGEITPASRASFALAFGISPDEQEAIELRMSRLGRGQWVGLRGATVFNWH